MTQIVVTGMHAVSPIGSTLDDVVRALRDGATGIGPISRFDCEGFPAACAGQVRGWRTDVDERRRVPDMLSDCIDGALAHAGLRASGRRVGLCVGLGRAPLRLDCDEDDTAWEAARTTQGKATAIAARYGWSGPVRTCYTACSTGNDVVGLGMRHLRSGTVDVMICGAADSQISPGPITEFGLLNALAPGDAPQRHPRPFDRRRGGFVIGEGAAAFVLESLEHARARGAAILGELRGYGASSDAFSLTRGHPEAAGAIRAMSAALLDGGLTAAEIDYINAHATGTVVGDALEAKAIHQVFGALPRLPPVSSTKAATGHLLAAAGAVELCICLLALEANLLPPTLNYAEPDAACALDCVPNTARTADITVAMSNALGFGGQNSALILSKARS